MSNLFTVVITSAYTVIQTMVAIAMLALILLGLATVFPGSSVGRLAAGFLKFTFAVPELLGSFSGIGVGRASALLATIGAVFSWLTDLARRGLATAKGVLSEVVATPLQWVGRFIAAPTVTCAVTITSSSKVIEWIELHYGLGWLATLMIATATCYLLALGMMRTQLVDR